MANLAQHGYLWVSPQALYDRSYSATPAVAQGSVQSRPKSKYSNLTKLLIVVITLLLAIGAAILLYFMFAPNTDPQNVPISLTLARTDLTYVDQMSDTTSEVFQTAATDLCNTFTRLVQDQLQVEDCFVTRFLAGSVKASPLEAEIRLEDKTPLAVLQLVNAILTDASILQENIDYEPKYTRLNFCNKPSLRSSETCDQICLSNLTVDTLYCDCYEGYVLSDDKMTCRDVDECALPEEVCGSANQCHNTEGSYQCICAVGYIQVNERQCKERILCKSDPCEYLCEEITPEQYTCVCPEGYKLDDNGVTCSDIDECEGENPPCDSCDNTEGSFKCSCNDGYILAVDGVTCIKGTLGVTIRTTPNGISCEITLTDDLVQIDNAEIEATWITKIGPIIQEVTGTGSTRQMDKLVLSDTQQEDHGLYTCVAKIGMDEKRMDIPYYVEGCREGYFFCTDNSLCIPNEKLCDGVQDCEDNSDETDSSCDCESGQSKCDNSNCIPATKFCNYLNDCGDWSDEYQCSSTYTDPVLECRAGSGYYQKKESFCDLQPHCPLGRDEGSICLADPDRKDTCPDPDMGILCDSRRCLSKTLECDDLPNCLDGADEPSTCSHTDSYMCASDSKYIPNLFKCDGIIHCADASDENDCTKELPDDALCHGAPCVRDGTKGCGAPYEKSEDKCIHPDIYCDGIKHLQNGQDDPDSCDVTCDDKYFLCDNKCRVLSKRCDGYANCADGTDEAGCACDSSTGLFRCDASSTSSPCLNIDQYCDGVVHCPNGEDEDISCRYSCPTGYLLCNDPAWPDVTRVPTKCIPNTQRCDGIKQCPAGSDEYDCDCGDGYRQCADGFGCVEETAECDGIIDCWDASDENSFCVCEDDEMRCLDDSKCVSKTVLCDGNRDCDDNSDETILCTLEMKNLDCPRGQFRCDGNCVDESLYCDGSPDCKDESDEPTGCQYDCPDFKFDCASKCVTTMQICDGKADCDYGKDESICQGMYLCEGMTQIALNYDRLCDGVRDCSAGDDETKCTDEESCKDPSFYCDGHCHSQNLWCDGKINCKDGSDESSCADYCGAYKADVSVLRRYFRLNMTNWQARGGVFNTTCDSGMCLPFNKWCDGVVDCPDGSDEKPACQIGCPDASFKCSDSCIPNEAVCDGVLDCTDGSDETSDECGSNPITAELQKAIFGKAVDFFTCSNGGWIRQELVCDGKPDCLDKSDESYETCCSGNDKFHCLDGKSCVPMTAVGDGKFDCFDLSDEDDPATVTCQTDEFACANQALCVLESKKCDGVNDCLDWSDEKDCDCPTGFFQCSESGLCIRQELVLDGVSDCPNEEDEQSAECPSEMFACTNGKCIEASLKCNGIYDCSDMSDETDCDCGSNEYKCQGITVCAHNSTWCNRVYDCPTGSDESPECDQSCLRGQISCDGRCVDQRFVCDGIRHCSDYSDEMNCECKWGTFQCKDKKLCVSTEKFCDRVYDCPDGSDEPAQCQTCAPHYVMCNGQCELFSRICHLPDVCPEIVPAITCVRQFFITSQVKPPPDSCGLPAFNPLTSGAMPFVVSGFDAVPYSQPWIVSVQVTDGSLDLPSVYRHICAGAIVSAEIVLTSTDCLGSYVNEPFRVRIIAGEYDLALISTKEQPRVTTTIKPFDTDDLAAIKLSKPLQFNDYVKPICLSDYSFPPNKICLTAGWGQTLGTGKPAVLKSVEVTIQQALTCVHSISDGLRIMCTGGIPVGPTHLCLGDYGAPLVCLKSGAFVLQGIAKYSSRGCPSIPDVWTNVTAYYSDINSMI